MELFYYPTMSGECLYQSTSGEQPCPFPDKVGDVKAETFTLNTGNLVVTILEGKFHSPLLLTRKALPVNDLYILSFDTLQEVQDAERKVEIRSCFFASATSEMLLPRRSGDVQQSIEIRISRAYLLKILDELTPDLHSKWANIFINNEAFQERITPLMEDFTFLESVFDMFKKAGEGHKLNMFMLENKIASLLLAFIERLFTTNTSEGVVDHTDYKKIKEVQHLIQEDLTNKYKIQELSARCNMCPTKFKQLFKRFTGFSISTFYNNIRMERALTWLNTHSQGNISEVAYSLGYKSLSHFTTAFKNYYGYAPTVVLKNINNSETRILNTIRIGKSA